MITSNSVTQVTPFFFGAIQHCANRPNRLSVFECAWREATDTYPGLYTDQCSKSGLYAVYQTIAFNHGVLTPHVVQTCTAGTNGQVPAGYYAILAPQELLDMNGPEPPRGESFNQPPAHNIGRNEGRLIPALRAAARVADPLNCSLRLAAIEFANNHATLGRAYADLSVTGQQAFLRFRAERPQEDYCRTLSSRQFARNCPAPSSPLPNVSEMRAGCHQALNRAYNVANFLRAGQSLAVAEKERLRRALGWIAVSGEDDQPHRPVNVPSSNYPQYDILVDVPAPRALQPDQRTIRVRSRFIVAQSNFHPQAHLAVAQNSWQVANDPVLRIDPDSDILLFLHGMDSRAEEAEGVINELFSRPTGDRRGHRNLVVIAVDLPSSGYASNIDHLRVSHLSAIGQPKKTPLPVPITVPPGFEPLFLSFGLPVPIIPPGTPIPDFAATGRTPVLDFIEEFIVRFVDTLDRRVPIKNNIKLAMGGSLGGNMSFRLGRRENLSWLPSVVVWSPASIWDSLAAGSNIFKHLGPRDAWYKAGNIDPIDPDDISTNRLALRREFFTGWDKPILPIIINMAQSDTWTSTHYPCHKSEIAAARLDRQETYDPRFLTWHWRLATEQLIYSHQTIDQRTKKPFYMSNNKRMLLMCGMEDNVPFNEICNATQKTAPHMTNTPGKAIFVAQTGHSIHTERTVFFVDQLLAHLYPPATPTPRPVATRAALCESCTRNEGCLSNRCDRGNGTQNTNVCITNDGTGNAGDCCSHNNNCRPGLSCTGRPGTCVQNGTVALSQSCNNHNQCRSRFCKRGKCQQKSNLCEACTSNKQCRSNRCDIGFGTQNTKVCIPNDGTGLSNQCCNHNNQCVPGLHCTSRRPGDLGVCKR